MVRRLADAVREHSLDDWRASRDMRRALWRKKALGGAVAAFGVAVATMFPNLPVIELGKVITETPGAYGLSALLSLSGGLVIAFMLVGHHAVEVTPLIHMPASMRKVYLHVLERVRRKVLLMVIGCLLFGSLVAVAARLAGNVIFWMKDVPQLAGVGVILGGSCLVWLLFIPLFSKLRWLGVMALILPVMGFIWLFLRSKMTFLPSPAFIGDQLLFLPQTKLFEWLGEGGPLPMDAFYYCAAMLALSLMALTHHLRDQQPEELQEMTLDAPMETAEAVLAFHLRQWRTQSATNPYERGIAPDEWMEDEALADDLPDVYVEPESENAEGILQPLQAYEDAPKEHSLPATPEFRERMASIVRGHLQARWSDEGLPPHLSSIETPQQAWSCLLKWALATGLALAVLTELPGHFQSDEIRGRIGPYCVAFGALIAVWPVLWWHPAPIWLVVESKLGWLPVDLNVAISAYRRWDRRVLSRRLGLSAVALFSGAVICAFFILIRDLASVSYSGAVHWRAFISGRFSLPNVAMILLGILLASRLFGIGQLAWNWTRYFTRISLLAVLMQILLLLASAAAIFTGVFIFCNSVSANWSDATWLLAPFMLLVSEVAVQLLLRSLVTVYRNTGDWKIS